MISAAANDIKSLFGELKIVDLDAGKEINMHGNYLVFDSFKPSEEMMRSGVFTFTLFMALKSIKRANTYAYADLDDVISAVSKAPERDIVCACRNIQLTQFSPKLFIYAITLEIERSW